MPKIIAVTLNGEEIEIEAQPGLTLMETLRDNGVDDILAVCGGACACATCHVYVEERFFDRLPVISSIEDDLLSCSDHRKDNSRLSCQIEVSDALNGMHVTVAPEE